MLLCYVAIKLLELRSKAATADVLSERVFLKIYQNSQENICPRVSFSIKFQACDLQFERSHALCNLNLTGRKRYLEVSKRELHKINEL